MAEMEEGGCATCRELLGEGLDLCVRARKMDSMDRRAATLSVSSDPDEWVKSGLFDKHVAYHNQVNPDSPIHTKSATVHLWMQDQYDKDLAEWEMKSRKHLLSGCLPSPPKE